MKSLWAGITNLIDPTRQSFMIFLFTFESCDRGRGGGFNTRPKSTIRLSHHIRLVPHPPALSRWLCCHFSLAKILSNYHKKAESNYLYKKPLFSGWPVKSPPFSDMTLQVQLAEKKNPKTWKKGWAYWQYLVRPRPWDLLSITHFSKKQDVVSLAAVCVHMSHVWPYFFCQLPDSIKISPWNVYKSCPDCNK